MSSKNLPTEIHTGCPELDLVRSRYADAMLARPGVLIADTDEELNWHAFLGHSIDMQGFRAAEFAGVDALTRPAADFVSLRDRRLGVPQLATLWEIPAIRDHFPTGTKGVPLQATLDVLSSQGGPDGVSLAEAFQSFPWRKFHWAVRALLQNSAVLSDHDHSFRRWLQHVCEEAGHAESPPPDFRHLVEVVGGGVSLERSIRTRLERTFYQAGPALAAYMICDWQLWLWANGQTAVFATFKLDSFHEQFVARHGRDLVPAGESEFTDWWLAMHPDLPPRLANECIWLGMENAVV